MTQYIDADALKEFIDSAYRPLCDDYHMKDYVLNQILTDIKNAPTVDAVEVIRCKDCRYYRDGDCWHEWGNDGRIYYQSVINEPYPDDYCSRAERKEE